MNDITEQLEIGISYSYIHYIYEYLELLNNSLYTSVEYLDKETFIITKELETIFLSLPDILQEKSKSKETCAAQLINFRKILESKFRTLNAYQRELHHLMTAFNMLTRASNETQENNTFSQEELESLDFDKLASDCVHFVFDTDTIETRQQRASLLLPYIPIKITRENYLDYVRKSIQKIAVPDTESAALLVSVLEQLFDGRLLKDYGRHFSDIAETLSDLNNMASEDDFDENAELLGETIDTLLEMLHHLYKITGSLSNLLLFDGLDFESVAGMHLSFNDLYYSVKNILTFAEDRELFLSTLPERADEIKASLQINYEKAAHLSEAGPLFSLMQTYLALDVDNVFGFGIQKPQNTSDELYLVFDPFIEELKNQFSKLSSQDRKLRMQYFMSKIPFVMSEKNFYTYIKGAFSHSSHPKQALTAVIYLSHILDESNALEDSASDGEKSYSSVHEHNHDHHHEHHHDNHHVHSHDCGCEDHHH